MFDYIHRIYQVPAEVGRRVIANGQPGTIVGATEAYIIVNLDKDAPHVAGAWHPTREMRYLNEVVAPRDPKAEPPQPAGQVHWPFPRALSRASGRRAPRFNPNNFEDAPL